MDETRLRLLLSDLPIPVIRYYETIPSTNSAALEWMQQVGVEGGIPDGSLLVANAQTAGRGRMNRQWVTEADAGLAFTLVFHPSPFELERLSLFSGLAALAICQVLWESYNVPSAIKWPNDVLSNGFKIAGILVETSWLGNVIEGIVVGIGINITSASVPPQEMLRFPAACIEDLLGQEVDRLEFLHSVLQALFSWRTSIGTPQFIQGWNEKLAFRGECVNIEQAGQPPITGIFQGVSEDGSLLLRTENGVDVEVMVGDVRLRPKTDLIK
jgi:BirA family biotin operon repressor/biotin-[acetyl-CoA-carboxylase] ligase